MPSVRRGPTKQEQILTAAHQLFLQHGYEHTSTDAVTAAAGVSKQTVYRYFPTKEALLAGVLQRATVAPVLAELSLGKLAATPTTDRDLEDFLVRAAQAILRRLCDEEYLALLRVMITEARRFPDLATQFQAAVAGPGAETLAAVFVDATDRGLIDRFVDPNVAVRLFIGPLLTFVVERLLKPAGSPKPPTRRQVEGLVRLFLRAIGAGPS